MMSLFLKSTLSGFLFIVFLSCATTRSGSTWADAEAPSSFKARFETTKGAFVTEFKREWSPLAVDRVYQLIRSGFYEDAPIYRVVENYVAQFGISNDSTKNSYWRKKELIDEPVLVPNARGTISFARGGPNSRGTSLFINLKNNSPRLDTLNYQNVIGFPVIGKIIENESIIDSLYFKYGNNPRQDSIQVYGNKYLQRNFPELDYIQRVTIIK